MICRMRLGRYHDSQFRATSFKLVPRKIYIQIISRLLNSPTLNSQTACDLVMRRSYCRYLPIAIYIRARVH